MSSVFYVTYKCFVCRAIYEKTDEFNLSFAEAELYWYIKGMNKI
jgi:hypothetical protein